MPQSLWRIRFYLPFDETNTINFVGSFENSGKRFLDDLVIFRGMYEIPDYLMWYLHKDLVNYNFAGYSMEVKLYLNGDPSSVYFQERFRIVDVGDDFKSDRKLIHAIQEDYAKLNTLLIDANITKLEFKEARTPEDVLKDVLEKNGIFPVKFIEHDDPDYMSIKFEYPKFTLDPRWTVGDFIKYVADENSFEWTIKYGILFIGPELHTYKELDGTREYIDRKVDNIAKNAFNVKIGFSGTPLDVLYYYQLGQDEKVTDMRCVWVKHFAGNEGDVTKACFVPVGTKMEKDIYLDSLEGHREIIVGYNNFSKKISSNPTIQICRVVADEGENEYANNVTIEKDIDQYAKKTPRNIVMNVDTPIYSVDRVGRTTPYLDHESGLLFPRSNDMSKSPNQLMFMVHDRIEQSVLGPYVMGNGSSDFVIPVKNPDDFRLQFPNGWCMYVDEDGNTLIQTDGMDASALPSEDTSKTFIKLNKDGTIDINTNNKNVTINQGGIAVSLEGHTHPVGGHTHQVTPGPAIPGPPVTTVTAQAVIQGETDKHSKNLKCEEA